MADLSGLDMAQVKAELIGAHLACSQRRLLHGAKWAAEMSKALEMEVDFNKLQQIQAREAESIIKDYDKFTLAHTYFDLKEYNRAAHELENCTSPKAVFLCLYSKYLADEKKKIDNSSDSIGPPETVENEHLKILRSELFRRHAAKELDGYGLYLYGVVLHKLDLLKEAREIFVEAVNAEPLHWGAWQELAQLITDKDMLLSLELPQHWVRHLFMAHEYLELQLTEEALRIYQAFLATSLGRSTYVLAQLAIAYHNVRETDQAVAAFRELQKNDPYRLENMDIFSNLLYVKELRADLAHLAHRCCEIDKYRVETCCIIGNYYSLRSQHEKAILYFQRALKLNPHYLSAWTLIGHEYMEMKNTSAAIQAYRQAIEVNKRDYRAWYGLGQTYEILKMPSYSLYYYRQAQQLRPDDSRMVMALGESFEKLERLQEAKKCFWKSHSMGDVEGTALLKLAKLYEKLLEEDQAAAAYLQYVDTAEREGVGSQLPDEVSQAYKYLANHYYKKGLLDEAYTAAQKCTEYIETREEGKTLLKQIQALRTQGEAHLDDSMGSLTGGSQFRGSDHTTLGRISPVNLCFTP